MNDKRDTLPPAISDPLELEEDKTYRGFSAETVAEATGRTVEEVLSNWKEGDERTAKYEAEKAARVLRAKKRKQLKAQKSTASLSKGKNPISQSTNSTTRKKEY